MGYASPMQALAMPRSLAAVALATALVACGGGDDDNDVVPPPPGGAMTQADAEAWSRVGASSFVLVDVARLLLQTDLGDYAADDLPAGQYRHTVNCRNGGTVAIDYRKTRGGAVGDYVQLNHKDCLDGSTKQDGMRRMVVTGSDRDGVHFEERFSDYSLRVEGALDLELDSGVIGLTAPAGGGLTWRVNGIRGDVEALNDQNRRAYAGGDLVVSGNGTLGSSSQQITTTFVLDTRHESGLNLRSVSQPSVVIAGSGSTGAVLLTSPDRAARVLNTLEGTRTVVQLDANGSGRYNSGSVIDARLY